MKRAGVLGAAAIVALSCDRPATPSDDGPNAARPLRAECYSVTSFEVRRDDGLVEAHLAVDLDEKGRALVNVEAAFPEGAHAIASSAFLWDGRRNDLAAPPGFQHFAADDLNERGEIVGAAWVSRESEGERRGFVWRDGLPVELGVRLAPGSRLRINELGYIAGTRLNGHLGPRAFLLRDGVVRDVGSGYARDLNDADDVVGWDLSGAAVVWRGGQTIALGATVARGGELPGELFINARGDVAGYFGELGAEHAFLFRDGSLTDLGTLGGPQSIASGLNNRGDVVGLATINAQYARRGFVARDGARHDLGTLGGFFSGARDINDRGQITGYSEAPGSLRAVVWDHGHILALPVGEHGNQLVEGLRINESAAVLGESTSRRGVGTRTLLWRPDRCADAR